jgi:hypothetical protein
LPAASSCGDHLVRLRATGNTERRNRFRKVVGKRAAALRHGDALDETGEALDVQIAAIVLIADQGDGVVVTLARCAVAAMLGRRGRWDHADDAHHRGESKQLALCAHPSLLVVVYWPCDATLSVVNDPEMNAGWTSVGEWDRSRRTLPPAPARGVVAG